MNREVLSNWDVTINPILHKQREVKWCIPEVGWLKINLDGPVIDSGAAYGGTITDHEGRLVATYNSQCREGNIHIII